MSRIEFEGELPDITDTLYNECPECLEEVNTAVYKDKDCTQACHNGAMYTINRRGVLFSAYMKCPHCGEVSGGKKWMVRF